MAVGCGSSKPAATKSAPVAPPPGLQAGTWTSDGITLSLSPEGRFQAIFKSEGTRSVVKGKAVLKDGKIVLEATDFDGRPPQHASEQTSSTFTFSPDWKNLTSEEGMILARKI